MPCSQPNVRRVRFRARTDAQVEAAIIETEFQRIDRMTHQEVKSALIRKFGEPV